MPDPVSTTPGLAHVEGAPVLVGLVCRTCDRRSFPASASCPWCGSAEVHESPLTRTGALWAWTAVTAAPPGYEGDVPYGFGVVQLDDDVRVIARLTESDPSVLEYGMPMELVAVDVGDDAHTTTWAFRPRESS